MKALLLTALILVAYSECHAGPYDYNPPDFQRINEQMQENIRYNQLQAQQQEILKNQEDMKRQMEWQAEEEKRANDNAWRENGLKDYYHNPYSDH